MYSLYTPYAFTESTVNEIRQITDYWLREAGVVGILPTPLEEVMAAAKLRRESVPADVVERFAATLGEGARHLVRSTFQKILGIVDLKASAAYLPPLGYEPREHWRDGHELSHKVFEWHNLGFYKEDKESLLVLTPSLRREQEAEANLGASEFVFQGRRFELEANDYKVEFGAIQNLATRYGASVRATFRQYIETQQATCAGITYLPSRSRTHVANEPGLLRPALFVSPSFQKKHAQFRPPAALSEGHPWAAAQTADEPCIGEMDLECGTDTVRFEWHSYWNNYELMVLLRKKPLLHSVGSLIRLRTGTIGRQATIS
jgi:hypothetical protein